MIAPNDVLPPPHLIQRRGWEAAYVLFFGFADRLHPVEIDLASAIVGTAPEALAWSDIGAALRTYTRHVAVRA